MNVMPPESPKMELVKEDYNPIKALQGPYSAHSIKAKYENYTASYINRVVTNDVVEAVTKIIECTENRNE